MTISNAVLIITTVCVGLMAGLFYSYSCSVVLGLGKLPDREYLLAMKQINRAIQNPAFFISFLGSLLLLPISCFINFQQPPSPRFWLILFAAIVYILGAFGTTAFGNIPLNNSLEMFDIANSMSTTISAHRGYFEKKWNGLNIIRTLTSVGSFILLLIACIYCNVNTSIAD